MKHLTAEQQINAEAHELAIKWLRDDDKTDMIDLTDILENQIVSVLSNGKIITSGLPQQITTNIAIEGEIEKDNEWLDNICNTVDWRNYHRAIRSYPRAHRMSLSKLSHGLWNTNPQNHKYYGTPNTCPFCHLAGETLDHVFHCSAPTAKDHQEAELNLCSAKLQKIKTPSEIESLLLAEITQSQESTATVCIRGDTADYRNHSGSDTTS
jgi:hypothetical protein